MTRRPTRRTFLRASLAGAAGALSLEEALARPQGGAPRLSVVCVGAHPDDPESGCGGTLGRFAAAGHRVAIVYLTRGERGIPGRSLADAASIRTAEAKAACKLLGARAVFAGQVDGETELTTARSEAMVKLLTGEQPDVVFAHWPVDTHPDHQVAGALAYQAWLRSPRRFQLFFFEVMTGVQTMAFAPTDWVDIGPARERKIAALVAHKSQDGEALYRDHHKLMEEFRGREAGVATAEAFVRLARDRGGLVPA